MSYQSLEEVTDAYLRAHEIENDALWTEGDILVHAESDGFDVRSVARRCAGLTRHKTSTIYNRYRTSATFPPEKRIAEVPWSLHMLAAQTDMPYAWLVKAADEHLSYRQLQDAISQHKPAPRCIIDHQDVIVARCGVSDGNPFLSVWLSELPPGVCSGMHINLTVVEVPVQALGKAIA